jgi:hypothetical protein
VSSGISGRGADSTSPASGCPWKSSVHPSSVWERRTCELSDARGGPGQLLPDLGDDEAVLQVSG